MSDLVEHPEPIVTVPRNARRNDLRWAIVKMVGAPTRDERVTSAERVLRSRSPHVESRHRTLARSIIDGPGDMIGAKMSHDWQPLSPAEPIYCCTACSSLLDYWNGEWCADA
jgi:hypothetical protein